jgi:hypothetical protein
MDAGVFSNRRAVLWAWILAPLLLLTALHVGVGAVTRRLDRAVARRRLALRQFPELEARNARVVALERQSGLAAAPSGTVSDLLGLRLNEAAQRHGFRVNARRLERLAGPQLAGARSGLRAAVEGEGSLLVLAQYLDDLQRPENLIVLQKAVIRLARLDPEPVYAVQLVLHGYQL